jgi:hypothetical protein
MARPGVGGKDFFSPIGMQPDSGKELTAPPVLVKLLSLIARYVDVLVKRYSSSVALTFIFIKFK